MEDTISTLAKKQFKKIWLNGLETYYIKFDDNALTKDGVLIKQSLFDNMKYQNYVSYINSAKETYDYMESLKNKKLVKNKPSTIDDNIITEEKPIIENKKTVKKKTSKNRKNMTKDYFVFFSKPIMFVLIIGSCILSIYYTGIHMSETSNNIFVGFLISTIMYLYGLIGSNFAIILRNNKKYFASILISVTSILTIIFSMCTSLFVNGDRYYKNKVEIEQELKSTDTSNTLLLENINEQIEQKKQLIQWYIDDTEAYNENHTSWESSGASKTTKENIDRLNKEITELQNKKMSIIEETPYVVTNQEHVVSFSDLLKEKLHIDGNMIQLFLLLFASVFIDIIGPLCLYIFRFKFEVKKNG